MTTIYRYRKSCMTLLCLALLPHISWKQAHIAEQAQAVGGVLPIEVLGPEGTVVDTHFTLKYLRGLVFSLALLNAINAG